MISLLCGVLVSSALGVAVREQTGQERSSLLANTWGRALDGTEAASTPVTRAVDLLKEMSVTLQKDMDEDQGLYDKLSCWCTDNSASKKAAITTNTEKVAELEGTIEELTASSGSLKIKIQELEGEVADNKDTLAKATALRGKELASFNNEEKEATVSIANLKSAIVVLSKHHGAALPQLSAVSFLQSASKKDDPWGLESKDQRELDMFMSGNSFDSGAYSAKLDGRFLQQSTPAQPKVQKMDDDWTVHDVSTVQSALRAASSFAQRRGQDASAYVPAYSAQSGEIFGVLKQLQEDMEGDLSDAQKTESKRAGDFSDLRAAKTSEIEGGEKSSEEKEDQLSKADNDLAEAKEDLGQTKTTLAEDTKFAKNLKKTCDQADANFAKRKESRLSEIKAVADTIEILTADEAKDAMSGTFKEKSFLQLSSKTFSERQRQAAKFLRRRASLSGSPQLALIASSAELNAFTKVKAMMDAMIGTLNTQQADEVKKNDYCTSEIQSNDMATEKAKDRQGDLDASAEERRVAVKNLMEELAAAKKAIGKEEVALQQATVNRKKENLDFQKTIADQTLTIEVLEKAMDRLATYYDEASFIQTHEFHNKAEQTPPVAQMKYEASKGSTGVMSLIEKLIYDAKEIMGESKKNEADSQAAYEELVEDSNGSIKSLGASVLAKTDAKVEAKKDLTQKTQDSTSTGKELENLGKTDTDLHKDCDYVLKNFMLRQKARSEEVESLKQAKMILSGASA